MRIILGLLSALLGALAGWFALATLVIALSGRTAMAASPWAPSSTSVRSAASPA
ncbi:hypothetical protein ACQ5SK_35695 [Bradyrhizobium japonicum]